eukprot:7382101-Lingulodinium_polyedra.AAC.1
MSRIAVDVCTRGCCIHGVLEPRVREHGGHARCSSARPVLASPGLSPSFTGVQSGFRALAK